VRELSLRDIDLPLPVVPRPGEVKIQVHTVRICSSDVHYYTHGKIGPFVVRERMVLGHEASCDRVCMEPGIPNPDSRASKLGIYNVDPRATFRATPRSTAASHPTSSTRRRSPTGCHRQYPS
jgi:D-xylulose reductase